MNEKTEAVTPVSGGEWVMVPKVDWLAEVIRSADGSHKLGAGALAEKIIESMLSAAPQPSHQSTELDPVFSDATYEWLDSAPVEILDYISRMEKKIIAAQLDNKRLREALEKIRKGNKKIHFSDLLSDSQMADIAEEALSTPLDTSAADALVKDAGRYRWLRSIGLRQQEMFGHYAEEELDAKIDAARKSLNNDAKGEE